MTIIIVTGLIMAYPLVSTQVIPGWGPNVALLINGILYSRQINLH